MTDIRERPLNVPLRRSTQPAPTAPVIAPEGGCLRLACCVPFCRRTFKNDKVGTPWLEGSRVICGKHWRMGNATARRRHSRLSRLQKRGIIVRKAGQIEDMLHALWDRILKQATEAAAGIG
ncbi:hypothetical protein UFOVP860_74 [uncultured Caudovirales phage]|uniref:Uncharacterized protein n=1 Tax=uncultured Caudovirales phage TaxID=2100421 RepID=A0A6J5T7P3_9CAUD|nr:hypothetical protein UFOVP860_74 [uncultured Caudovirales phage]CAB4195476.1 hypothetical protein UFOVP1293_37 [uncultured Caudovirales phage]CAB4222527.1 hypothetical protein UFOVP1644_55 [uncultured Caudovirales phage]